MTYSNFEVIPFSKFLWSKSIVLLIYKICHVYKYHKNIWINYDIRFLKK